MASAYYDDMMRAVVRELPDGELRDWIAAKIPGPDDEVLNFGPWFQVADQQLIDRNFDLRTLTPTNQTLFVQAVRKTASRPMPAYECDKGFEIRMVREPAKMLDAIDRGDDPLSHSL